MISAGHPVGDLLLQQVAEQLEALIGAGGYLGWFGGDEFALALSQAGLASIIPADSQWTNSTSSVGPVSVGYSRTATPVAAPRLICFKSCTCYLATDNLALMIGQALVSGNMTIVYIPIRAGMFICQRGV